MKYLSKLLIIILFGFSELNAQLVLYDGFESGTLNQFITFQSTGTFLSNPGIKDNSNFGSNKVFGFGKSTCGSNCFANFQTTLIVTFPNPTFVESIMWKEMEIDGNWGSQGVVLLDDIALKNATLGALPVNSNVPDAAPRNRVFGVNQTVTTIKLVVTDITSSSEIIIDDFQIKTTSKIVGYEYWFNNDFLSKTTTSVESAQQLIIDQNIPTTELTKGLNILNFRSFDNLRKYSSVVSHFFYKISLPESTPNPEIVAYEFWLDNDYNNAVLVNTPVHQQVNINELISMSSLSNGIHNFNIRFKNNSGLWSSVVSHLFYKTPERIFTENSITEYHYWFDNDFANAVNASVNPDLQINLTGNLDLTRIPKGKHEINFQFKDAFGKWSAVIADSIEKVSLPIADFSSFTVQDCNSAIVTYTNNSIDGDKYLWDFGDGNTSTLANPTHIYYTPDNYQVSLTVTDTLLGKDSNIVLPVLINTLHTTSTINESSCVSYLAPDGQSHTSSGIKTVTVPNAAGCDSIITINLTINTADVSVIQDGLILTANATAAIYQWLNCNNGYSIINGETSRSYTVTQNGSYAVEVTQNSCVDTSTCFSVTTVGILVNTFGNEITVFPNPTLGIVKIDLGEFLYEFNVRITDASGKIISQSIYKNTKMFELDLNTQPGIYLLNINSGNKKATIRLIKN